MSKKKAIELLKEVIRCEENHLIFNIHGRIKIDDMKQALAELQELKSTELAENAKRIIANLRSAICKCCTFDCDLNGEYEKSQNCKTIMWLDALNCFYDQLAAENERLKEAWEKLRPSLEQYNYNVDGKPTVVREGILNFEQALKGEQDG